MINKEYWDNFYKKNIISTKESNFALYTLNYIRKNKIKGKLVDIACGNGRDTVFFIKNNIKSIGIDLSVDNNENIFEFYKENLLTFDYSNYNIFYLRFVVHTLKENELDLLLSNLSEIKQKFFIFIETRSSKKITNEDKSETFFKSPIGDVHYRMLYSKKYLDKKLSAYFKILESKESTGFAIYKEEDPYCIRYVLTNK